MKIPEKAPDLSKISPLPIAELLELKAVIRKANREYLYWDKFKYLIPSEAAPQAWSALKMSRTLQTRIIPLKDKDGNAFSYWLPDCALEYLHQIDQDAGGVVVTENPSLHASQKKWYLMSSIAEEAIASSQIEGAVTTRQRAKHMLQTGSKPKDKSEQMIYNNYNTILTIKERIDEPLTPELLRELQGSMTKDTLDDPAHEGRFRMVDDEPVKVYDYEGNILYTPPSAKNIPETIELLCNFAKNEPKDEFIHPVVKATILHFWLAYIHPFNDGNGRTARALFYWYMLKSKYWLFEYLSISRVILKARVQYYRAFLYSEIDERDMTYFVVFHLKAISTAIKELNLYIREKLTEVRSAATQWNEYPSLNYRQKDVLSRALSNPGAIFSFKEHMQVYHVVHQTARTDLLELYNLGLLKKIKSGKAYHFVYEDSSKRQYHQLQTGITSP